MTSPPPSPKLRNEEEIARDGYMLEADQLGGRLRTASDGHTVLIPQPTDDPNDPLNGSPTKKHIILFMISTIAFLPDFGSSLGAVTLIPQSKQWDLPEVIVQHNLVGNLFMLGVGGLFAVTCSHYFGRAPTLFWFYLVAFATSIWCAVALSFESFEAARIVNGFFATVAQSVRQHFKRDRLTWLANAVAGWFDVDQRHILLP